MDVTSCDVTSATTQSSSVRVCANALKNFFQKKNNEVHNSNNGKQLKMNRIKFEKVIVGENKMVRCVGLEQMADVTAWTSES